MRPSKFQKGEITTIIALGTMAFILVSTLATSLISKKPQTTSTQAALSCPSGTTKRSGTESSCNTICSKWGETWAYSYELVGTTRSCCCKSSTSGGGGGSGGGGTGCSGYGSKTYCDSTCIDPNKICEACPSNPDLAKCVTKSGGGGGGGGGSSSTGCCTISDLCNAYSCGKGEKYVKKYPNQSTPCSNPYTTCPAGVDWHNAAKTEGCVSSPACGGGSGEGCTLTGLSCPSGTGTYNSKKGGTGTTADYTYYPSSNSDCSGNGSSSISTACSQNTAPTSTPGANGCVFFETCTTGVGGDIYKKNNSYYLDDKTCSKYSYSSFYNACHNTNMTPIPINTPVKTACGSLNIKCCLTSGTKPNSYCLDNNLSCVDNICINNSSLPTKTPTPTIPTNSGEQICKDMYGSDSYCSDNVIGTCDFDEGTETICGTILSKNKYCCIPKSIASWNKCFYNNTYYSAGESVCIDTNSYKVCQNANTIEIIGGGKTEWSQAINCPNCYSSTKGKVTCNANKSNKCDYGGKEYSANDQRCDSASSYVQCLSTGLWSSSISCLDCKQNGTKTTCSKQSTYNCQQATGKSDSYCDKIGGCMSNYEIFYNNLGNPVACQEGIVPGRCCVIKNTSSSINTSQAFTSTSQQITSTEGITGKLINIPGFGLGFLENL